MNDYFLGTKNSTDLSQKISILKVHVLSFNIQTKLTQSVNYN